MKIHLISLGCPKNLVDSEVILGGIVRRGVEVVSDPRQADAILINTCGFIEDAKKESIETIFSAIRLKNMGYCQYVLVTGCLSERYRDALKREIPEIDGLWGARGIGRIPYEIARFLRLPGEDAGHFPRFLTERTGYAYLKIAEGCDNLCSFCAIPAIRGKHVSRPEEEILEEARELAGAGIRELILVAQDTTYYGRDLPNGATLSRLLRKLETVEGLDWIRVLYLYPERITDELIATIAESEKICHYLDIPIQHISDRILRLMKRGSRRATIERLLEKIRKRIPDVAIRTSLIVGFPGETEEDFEELLGFVRQAEFERLGVFRFSPEEGTEAADYGNPVSDKLMEERFNAVMEIQREISLRKNSRLIGRKLQVIIDGRNGKPNEVIGRTRWDAPEIDQMVYIAAQANPGDILEVTITEASEHDLRGEA